MSQEQTRTIDDLPDVIRRRVVAVESGCWEWTGGKSSKGYGRANVAGKLEHPHRLSARHFGILTNESLMVCHACDNPPCCNPAHLFQCTRSENMKDAARKGRLDLGHRSQIKAMWNKLDGPTLARRAATESLRQIADSFGCNHKVISRALNAYLDSITPSKQGAPQ